MSFSVRIEKLKQPNNNVSSQDPYHKRKKLREQRSKEPNSSHTSEMLDFGESSSSSTPQRLHHHTVTEKEKHKEKKKSPAKQLPQLKENQMLFKTGNPRVEEVCGVIHLFKKIKTVPEEAPACETPEETNSTTTISAGEVSPLLDAFKDELPKERSTKVCVLAVPSFMSVADFCDFIACFKSKMRWIRIVRDDSPNKYMVLLKFDSQKSADSFYLQYNGRQFNSLDPEDCKIVFVSKIEIEEPSSVEPLTPNSATPAGLANALTEEGTKVIELPTCPVCLDRLDSEVSGIITTMCNHRFHCDCLTKWGDGTCPVCRYSHQVENECGACGLKDNLWICLTCGNIGCGRYNGGHAREHFEQSGHTYSMEIDSQRVWDYTGDGYVHRLVQNKTDGKFIEIPNPEAKKDAELVEAQFQSKLDSILSEYNSLLANQLSSQRVYFEAMLRNTEKEKDAQIENVLKEARALRADRKNLMTKIEKLEQQLKKSADERKFTEQINETLTANQKQFKELNEQQEKKFEKKLQEKDAMIRDLEDQVRDLMLHFETQQKLNSNPNKEEVHGASIVISPATSSSSSGGGKKKKNKKR